MALLPVAILAGGLATRMKPLTETIPKALIDVNGTPFIIHQLRSLRKQGVARVVLCVGHLGEMIEEIVGDGGDIGLDIRYSYDGSRLLGTGGALINALPVLAGSFFVMYGDSFLPVDLNDIQKQFLNQGRPAGMTVFKNNNNWDTSNVLFSNGEIIDYNKRSPRAEMKHIDYGLGVFKAECFDVYEVGDRIDLEKIYHDLIVSRLLYGMEVFERFYEIGSPHGLRETIEYFKSIRE